MSAEPGVVREPGTSTLPTLRPQVTDDNAPYWNGAREGRLVLPRCLRCAGVIWYPKHFCAHCNAFDVEWFTASGRGTLYSFTVMHRGPTKSWSAQSYIYAYVELDEGPRVATNVVDTCLEDVRIGVPVTAVFDACDDEVALVRFRVEKTRPHGRVH